MNKDFKFEDLYEAIYKILPNEDLQELMDVCYEDHRWPDINCRHYV